MERALYLIQFDAEDDDSIYYFVLERSERARFKEEFENHLEASVSIERLVDVAEGDGPDKDPNTRINWGYDALPTIAESLDVFPQVPKSATSLRL